MASLAKLQQAIRVYFFWVAAIIGRRRVEAQGTVETFVVVVTDNRHQRVFCRRSARQLKLVEFLPQNPIGAFHHSIFFWAMWFDPVVHQTVVLQQWS
jgi:hypothetical protein